MERYSAYKDSSIDWIGKIPTGWNIRRVKTFATASGGGTPSKDNLAYWNGDIPWVSSAEVKQKFIDDTSQHISEEAVESSSTNMYPAGTTVMVVRSGILKHTIPVAFITRDMAVNQDIKAFTFNAYSKRFFRYFINGMNDQLLLVLTKSATTVDNIDMDQFMICPFTYPPTQEQELIADYLDKKTGAIDTAVADIERSIELLNEYRQSVISEAVTKGLDPTVPMKDSGIDWIGQIPEHWQVTKIVNLATRKSGHTPDKKNEAYWRDGDIVWVSLADSPKLRQQHYISESCTMTNMDGIRHSSAELLPAGSVLLSRDASIGLTAIASKELAVSQHFMAYICGPNLYNEYLYYVFESMQQELQRLSMGSTIPTIGLPLIHQLVTPLPSVDEQHVIVNHLERKLTDINSLIQQKQSLLVRLKEYRSSLISECVTGKVKIPGVEE
ncbi:restriction endonuclease subunit S [Bifidobacterium biavatii]|uniref:Restriction modification system DNA specificity subunit n=1 Tax=Bifidobacterium biavatii DSM 23969 TaxID=1437608 RepID=A0A087A0C6_9BIFI|nr:restriction endonuclease subunit S [Bifidobacterium biavatii]KFI52226.1 restriction modification system DNA specificity subunit [Bifidobacterium biavatii DSM 23969]